MFSIDSNSKPEKQEKRPELHIENRYADFLPENFRNHPQKYIEDYGENIKSGKGRLFQN